MGSATRELELSVALSRAASEGAPLLVHGEALEPAGLTRRLEAIFGAGSVQVCDCTRGTPPESQLQNLFANGLRAGRVLHVAVDGAISSPLWDAILTVVSDKRVPGSDNSQAMEGLLVLSARVRFLSELKRDLRELFPVSIGEANG